MAALQLRLTRARELGPRGLAVAAGVMARYWGRILRQTFRLFVDNRGPYQANALAYRTMISLVPMLAFMISLLTLMMGKGIEDLTADLSNLMATYLVPNPEIVDSSLALIKTFIQQARQGTVIGFIILLLTSIFLLTAIEQIFNNLWHITRRRPYSWRILAYTSLIVLIPVLLGFSIYMTARLQVDQVMMTFTSAPVIRRLPILQWGWGLTRSVGVPLLLVWVLFLAMFKWLPNTRVEPLAAMVAGLIAAMAFELCKWGFSAFATEMVVRRQLWWGSLGVFLVFLMWVYLIWWIVLFCAQLTYVIQNYRYVLRNHPELEGRVGIAFIAANTMLEIARRHFQGEQPPTIRVLAEKLEVEVPRVQQALSKLVEANLVILGSFGKDRDLEVYLPGRDLGGITLTEVVGSVTDIWRIPASPKRLPRADAEGRSAGEEKLETLLRQSRDRVQEVLDVTIRELLA
jgi:membrane protein